MLRCRLFQFFLRWLPGRKGKGFVLRHHVDRCPSCQKKLASAEEARILLWQAEEMQNLEGLATSLRLEFQLGRKELAPARSKPIALRAAAACVMLLLVLGGVFLIRPIFFRGPRTGKETGRNNGERFSLTRLRIGGEPANPIVYRPLGSEHIFVWAQKRKDIEVKEESP